MVFATPFQQKFQSLPPEFKKKISSPEFLAKINDIEVKFNITLGATIMRLVTNDLTLDNFIDHIQQEKKISALDARKLKVIIYQNLISPIAADLQQLTKDSARQVIQNKIAIRQPINLKDVFTGEGGETEEPQTIDEDFELIDWQKEATKLREEKRLQAAKAVEEVMAKIKVVLPDGQQKKLRDIIFSRMKNIRDAVDTRLALGRDLDKGGVGLNDTAASTVSIIVENYLKNDWPPKIDLPIKTEKTPLVKAELVREPVITPEPVALAQTINDVPSVISQKEKPSIPPANLLPPESKPAVINQPPAPNKSVIQLVGPVDELRSLTIEEWRKLYPSVDEGVSKIKEKIINLGKESFTKRVAGVKAWQKGLIMKLYLTMGEESWREHLPLKVAADKRRAEGKSYLTENEFHAIMDLNNDLRNFQ